MQSKEEEAASSLLALVGATTSHLGKRYPEASSASIVPTSSSELSPRLRRRSSSTSSGGASAAYEMERTVMVDAGRHSGTDQDSIKPVSKSQSVPLILMTLLMDEKHNNLMSFSQHGESFSIHSEDQFASSIMPPYFHLSKFGAFVRKLQRWGFEHVHQSKTGLHTFSHPLFRRGDWNSLTQIRYTPRNPACRFDGSSLLPPTSMQDTNDSLRTSTTKHSYPTRSIEDIDVSNSKRVKLGEEGSFDRITTTKAQITANGNTHDVGGSVPFSRQNRTLETMSHEEVNKATKSIVEAAVDCLLRDEDHTLSLLARRGHELSTPITSRSLAPHSFGLQNSLQPPLLGLNLHNTQAQQQVQGYGSLSNQNWRMNNHDLFRQALSSSSSSSREIERVRRSSSMY